MGLAEITEQKKLSVYHIAIYVVLFLISGYISFNYLISPELKKFQSAREAHDKEKGLLKELESRAQDISVLANNVTRLEAELTRLRGRVFNEEYDILTFMRSLPDTTAGTGNSLMSIVPMEIKVINSPTPPPAPQQAPNPNNKTQQTTATASPPAPQTLLCKMKPIEISFEGGYGSVIGFFNELEKAGQYISASSMMISGAKDPSTVSVKAVLNLVQLDIGTKSPQVHVADLYKIDANKKSVASTNQPSTPAQKPADAVPTTNVVSAKPAEPIKSKTTTAKPVSSVPISSIPSTKPTQPAKQATNVVSSVKNVPSTTTPLAKPVVKTVKPSETPKQGTNITSSAKNTPVVPAQKPMQSAKQATSITNNAKNIPPTTTQATKPVDKITKPIESPKQVASIADKVKPDKKKADIERREDLAKPGKPSYSVRVGKFDYNENAQKLLNILKSHGYSAWLKTYSNKGKTSYWVYVGKFDTEAKAEAFATLMQKELSYIDDYVIMGVKNGFRKKS